MAGSGTPSSSALQREGSTVGAGEERQRLGLVLEAVRHDDGERIRIKSVTLHRITFPNILFLGGNMHRPFAAEGVRKRAPGSDTARKFPP